MVSPSGSPRRVHVVVADVRRDPKQGDRYDTDATVPTDELVSERGVESLYVETDVAEEDDVRTLVERTVGRFGSFDVLVNNAGLSVRGGTRELPTEDWDRQVDVNLRGHYLTAKHAIEHLAAAERGRIVSVSSINARFGGAGPAYSATKAAVCSLSRDMAAEFAPEAVTVNAVLPGVVKTPMQDLNDEETMRRQRDQTALPRLGEPRDIASAVAFLASADAEWITGAELVVDGGVPRRLLLNRSIGHVHLGEPGCP